MRKTVSIIVPVYNEQENIHVFVKSLASIFVNNPSFQFNILFVDDGSNDNSRREIIKQSKTFPNIGYLFLSRNFGKDKAMLAGIQHSNSDAVITMDADLQHPPSMINEFIAHWQDGFDVVYAYRKRLKKEKISSILFYKLFNNLSDIEFENGIADFRLLDKQAVESLKLVTEDSPFLRGLTKWIGFNQKGIPYSPTERINGQSSYRSKQLIKLAIQGITSFSIKPLYIATYLGFVFSLLALAFVPYVLYSYYFGKAVSGWTSTIITIAFFGGLQLMILGIIGIYLGKLFMQSKGRPLYIVQQAYLPNEA